MCHAAAYGASSARAQAKLTNPVILSSCHINSPDRAAVVRMWADVQAKINPHLDIVLVDSASPIPTAPLLFDKGFVPSLDAPALVLPGHTSIIRIDQDIGKRNNGGKDGGVQALMVGLEAVMLTGRYTHVAYVETDMFYARPIDGVTGRMARKEIGVTMPMDGTYQFLETGLAFYEIELLKKRNYTKSYDWNNPPADLHEVWTEKFFFDDLHLLFARGLRNDLNQINRQNIGRTFGLGIDYLTHCQDSLLYAIMMGINGINI